MTHLDRRVALGLLLCVVLVGCGGSIYSEGSVKNGHRCNREGSREADYQGNAMVCAFDVDGALRWQHVYPPWRPTAPTPCDARSRSLLA